MKTIRRRTLVGRTPWWIPLCTLGWMACSGGDFASDLGSATPDAGAAASAGAAGVSADGALEGASAAAGAGGAAGTAGQGGSKDGGTGGAVDGGTGGAAEGGAGEAGQAGAPAEGGAAGGGATGNGGASGQAGGAGEAGSAGIAGAGGGCSGGTGDCDSDASNGCETDTDTDTDHCGSCGFACSFANAQAACAQGVCQLGACDASYEDCNADPTDGCEVFTGGDPQHCGACGQTCPEVAGQTATCTQGQCGLSDCASPLLDCDGDGSNGCEVDTSADPHNCGTCGNACAFNHGSAACVAGQCKLDKCDAGFADCDDNGSNGCETDTQVSVSHCGACGQGCSSINGTALCSAGACALNCTAGFADCDGANANGCELDVTQPCSTSLLGECAGGVVMCTGGLPGCQQLVAAEPESCDGKDNDCDGTTDEGDPGGGQACDTGLAGLCAPGTTLCSGAAVVCKQNAQPGADVCDGLDNDCDGVVDDGNPGGGQACNTGKPGLCAGGVTACNSGVIMCQDTVQPTNELCDGLDNNCNGQVDENNPGGGVGCDTGKLGLCSVGETTCSSGALVCVDKVQPASEICDGLDNNCNGQVDDGNPGGGASCNTGKPGLCAAGITACTSGVITCVDTLQPAAEACDGKDNNCNGQVDEGNPGGGLTCNTGNPGVCAAGLTACSGGMLLCNQTTMPTAEVCDAKDNNCNGQIDEGNPGGGLACNTGKLGACAAGVTACTAGAVSCNQTVQASPEVCDGVDNNCNGQVDEANPGGGVACDTGKYGVCAAGVTACSSGSLVCNQTTQPGLEVCDGKDNNCDGQIDEGSPGGGVACTVPGQLGLCQWGTTACINGGLYCMQTYFPQLQDVCGNGLDDNCNGQIDENVDADGDGWGHCDGDCCDVPGSCSNTPGLVNPGAYEVVGNLVDDDCDPATSDTVPQVNCSPGALSTTPTASDLAKSMELCQFTTQSPPLAQRKWGVLAAQLLAADQVSTPPQAIQTGVLANYGPNVLPRKYTTMAALSSGTARDQGDPGWVQPNGGWGMGGYSSPPPVYLAAHNGVLQTKPGCPAGSGANDSVNLKLRIRVPTNAKSFSFKFKFYSSEYPEWICTQYNDFFLALLTSQVPGIPADHNLSFDALNNPVSVNNGFFQVCSGCSAGTAELIGTGMGGNNGALTDGGGTLWLTTTSPIKPGEDMTIEFIIFDTSDHAYDSLVLLDDWKWDLNPAEVGTTPS